METLEGNKVKLYVEVDEAEFEHDIDRAFKLIAKEVNLPGFRAGKAPRKVLEARVGVGVAREQALRDAVPQYLAKAVREHEIDLIATPQVEITDGAEGGPVEFDATCEVRPTITVRESCFCHCARASPPPIHRGSTPRDEHRGRGRGRPH